MGASFGGAVLLCAGGPIDARVVSALTVGNTLLVAVTEQLLPRIPTTNLLRDRQSLNDMAHGVVFTFLGRPAAAALSVGLVTALASVSGEGLLALWPREAPLLAQLALAIIAFDLGNDAFTGTHAEHGSGGAGASRPCGCICWKIGCSARRAVPPGAGGADSPADPGLPSQVMLWLAFWTVFEGNLAHSNLDQRFPSSGSTTQSRTCGSTPCTTQKRGHCRKGTSEVSRSGTWCSAP